MNPHPDLEKLLNWLLNHSLQAGALVLLVLAVQWIFRRQLTHRWRFALWWIVLARLLLPFSPQSAVSVFNYFQPRVSVDEPRYPVTPVPVPVGAE
jgi:bla regulator protein BlaR1